MRRRLPQFLRCTHVIGPAPETRQLPVILICSDAMYSVPTLSLLVLQLKKAGFASADEVVSMRLRTASFPGQIVFGLPHIIRSIPKERPLLRRRHWECREMLSHRNSHVCMRLFRAEKVQNEHLMLSPCELRLDSPACRVRWTISS